MRRASRLAGGLAMAAILATSASPAMAGGGWYGGYHQNRHYGHDDGFGAFLGVAAVIGAAAVIASSADSKAKAAPEDQAENSYPPEDTRPPESAEPAGEEEAAVDDCAIAARDEASQDGYYAEVRDITGTQPTSDGGWQVDGTLDQRQGFRGESRMRSFSCTWRDGQVADVVLDREDIAGHRSSGPDHSGMSS